jgi:hypothetical protein
MEGHTDFLAKIVDLLNGAGIPHMLAGSVASMAYSGPRNTNDVDIVIQTTLPQLNRFLETIDTEQLYVSAEAARAALSAESMFNLIDFNSGWKVDLIFLKSRAFDLQEFERRVPGSVWGTQMPMLTPEDSILSKLEWRKESQSERQYEDAAKVAQSMWTTLDFTYLRKWGRELGVSDDLDRLLKDADELRPR